MMIAALYVQAKGCYSELPGCSRACAGRSASDRRASGRLIETETTSMTVAIKEGTMSRG